MQEHMWPIAGGVVVGVITSIYVWKKYKSSNKYEQMNWKEVGKLSSIYVYPVKSCQAISVPEAQCTEVGLRSGELRDRSLVIIGDDGIALWGKNFPPIATVVAKIAGRRLTLEMPGNGALTVDLEEVEKRNEVVTLDVLGAKTSGLNCGSEAAKFLSNFVLKKETGARLVYHTTAKTVRVNNYPKSVYPRLKTTDNPLYANRGAYMLLTEASLDDLNTKLDDPVVMGNFRPNFVVSEAAAFAEDSWTHIKIGDVILRNIMPCNRCAFTTVNPDTGVMHPDGEPMKTLKKYRTTQDPALRKLKGNVPIFGSTLGINQLGHLSVGMPVYAVVEG